jgi:hypothetical protein
VVQAAGDSKGRRFTLRLDRVDSRSMIYNSRLGILEKVSAITQPGGKIGKIVRKSTIQRARVVQQLHILGLRVQPGLQIDDVDIT